MFVVCSRYLDWTKPGTWSTAPPPTRSEMCNVMPCFGVSGSVFQSSLALEMSFHHDLPSGEDHSLTLRNYIFLSHGITQ